MTLDPGAHEPQHVATPSDDASRLSTTRLSTTLLSTKAELRTHRAAMTGTVAAVFTMGSLHAGHLALVERARELADHVILTDFVNPLQFGPGEDFEAYPRDLDADLALVDGLVDVVFAPTVQEMVPVLPPTVSVTAGRAGTILEGAARPGHFDGVVTVVAKLLQLTAPDLSVFGRKDAQQLAIIQALVADLDLPVRIEPVALSRTLTAALDAAPSVAGIRSALAEAVGRAEIAWDYALALDPGTLEPIAEEHRGEVLVALAGRVEGTRLLDAAVAEATAP